MLAGALAVGESVRQSLHDLALARLGRTQYAVVASNFFRESLIPECPLIALEAAVTHDSSGRRASGVAVYGVDQRFWEFHRVSAEPPGSSDALLSPGLAAELGAKSQDTLLIRLPRVSAVPVESLHGAKSDPGRTIRTRFRNVLSRRAMGEFSLRLAQGEVRAVFLPLKRLQRELNQDGRVNLALSTSQPDLRARYTLEDLGIHLRGSMLETDSIVFSDSLVRSVLSIDPAAQPVLTYVANVIRANGREVPYSLIAAADRPDLAPDLADDKSIVVNEWLRSELNARSGDPLQLEYYVWDPSGRLATKSASFRISGTVPVNPDDRELAPEYPGISGAASIADWDPPFPVDLKRIRPADERYWDRYRATPKAYIRLKAGQDLWRSRYGGVTSLKVSPSFSQESLRRAIDPENAGLTVVHARAAAEAASRGSTDFSEYFLYFSFFLIVSALLLAGLFFRFGLEQRLSEIATLRAIGYSGRALRRLFLTETLAVAAAGGGLAVLGTVLYGALILTGLQTWWSDAVGSKELHLHLSPSSAGAAVIASIVLGPAVVLLGLRKVLRHAPRETREPRARRPLLWAGLSATAGVSVLFIGGAAGFFGAGSLLLIAILTLTSWWIRRRNTQVRDVTSLGFRYTAHHPGRTVLCIALISGATFLVVSVEAFRRHGSPEPGMWRFYGETAIPIYYDPNTQSGREALNLGGTPEAKWLTFRLRPGDDASCLNLYSPRNPRVLGVSASFLELPPPVNGAISAAVDANTLEYVLHRRVGDVLEVGGARLRIAKTLSDSVFQSELLISDADFQRAWPEEGGYRVFLVEAPLDAEGPLESALSDYGLDLTTTASRLASFHRVENTWLSTFQALGGLGLVLGTVGLGTVLLRNVLERRRELALLRAVGYRPEHLMHMLLAENTFVLLAGVICGTLCAFIAVTPTVLRRGGSIPVLSVAGLLAAVLLTGIVSSLLAIRVIRRAPLLPALRSE